MTTSPDRRTVPPARHSSGQRLERYGQVLDTLATLGELTALSIQARGGERRALELLEEWGA